MFSKDFRQSKLQKKTDILDNTMYALQYIWRLDKKFIGLLVISAVLTSMFNIINVYILKYITNTITLNKSTDFIIIAFAVLGISTIVTIINGYINYLFEPVLQNNIIHKIQNDIYTKTKSFNLDDFEDKSFYDLYYYVVENSKDGILDSVNLVTSLLASVLSLFGLMFIIFQYDILIIIFAFLGVMISSILNIRIKKVQYNFKIDLIPANRDINYIDRIYYMNEFIKDILVNSHKDVFEEKYSRAWTDSNNITRKWGKILKNNYISIATADSITETIILIYLGYQTIKGRFPLSSFIVMFTGSQQMINQLKAIVSILPEIYSNSLDLSQYFEFMNRKRRSNKDYETIDKIEGIKFNNISFSYPGSNKEILKNISFEIGQGVKKIALVGSNGCGKTTLIKILLGLYDNFDGNVLFNGVKINRIDKSQYRTRIAVLFQDFQLFSLTVAQNIMMKYTLTEGDVKIVNEVLKCVQMKEKIDSLSLGIHTVISKEFENSGVNFSGGERQKIALARILAQNADVIILDEPFSSFDNISEQEILKEFLDKIEDKMVIVISHNLINLNCMDKILVLDNGKVVEEGVHDQLLKIKGYYYKLFEMQRGE